METETHESHKHFCTGRNSQSHSPNKIVYIQTDWHNKYNIGTIYTVCHHIEAINNTQNYFTAQHIITVDTHTHTHANVSLVLGGTCSCASKPPSSDVKSGQTIFVKRTEQQRQFVVNCWVCKFEVFFLFLYNLFSFIIQFFFISFVSLRCYLLFACWLVRRFVVRALYVLKVLRALCISFVCHFI